MQEVTLHDKTFTKFISEEEIIKNITELAEQLKNDFSDKNPLFLAVLNGSFMFAAELMKHMSFPCEIQFVKVSSYQGTSSTESISQSLDVADGLVKNKTVIVIEDIVDTGHTIEYLDKYLRDKNAHEVHIATLLLKPDAYKKELPVNYVAMKIPNDFVVGYGLDYDQLGRNLKHIYKLKEA
ncbi:MAG: hypoxanthine phosphoribosyltransferase [Bacteroidia bacterium]